MVTKRIKKIRERLEELKLSERKKKDNPIEKRNNKKWKDLDEKLKSLQDEEIAKNLKNLQIKSTVQSFKERQERRRNLRRKNYDSEEEDKEDEQEKLKLAEQIEISKKFFDNYEKQRKHNKFLYLDEESEDNDVIMGNYKFGKKQKKDIKGMIKKILLYGGLPTLLVVSLGVLSNKKLGKGKIKKNIKVKVSEEEKRFKQVFVKLVKKMILKRKKELDGMEKDSKKNVIETNTRQINRRRVEQEIKRKRDRIADAALRRQLQNKLKIKQPPSNPQQSVVTPPSKKTRLEIIKERQQQKIPSNKIFIKIERTKENWSLEEEKDSNYYIKNGKIYNKKGKLTNYIYTDKDGLGLRTNNQIIPFIKTEQLKKV